MVGNGNRIDGIGKISGAGDGGGKLLGVGHVGHGSGHDSCAALVVLYKVGGGGACDFSFSECWGPILKCPLAVGSKMICLGCS